MTHVYRDYTDTMKRIIDHGEMQWIEEKQCYCKAVIGVTWEYLPDYVPIVTSRLSYYKSAIGEILGYAKGATDVKEFEALKAKTWRADCDKEHWVSRGLKRHDDDLGLVYGAVANDWPKMDRDVNGDLVYNGEGIDTLDRIYQMLKEGKDDRKLIWTFWSPGTHHLAALPPCMHSHHFNLINGKLYVESTQRSMDQGLGGNFNRVQAYVTGKLMAQITGNVYAGGRHHVSNCHLYENHLETAAIEVEREPFEAPQLIINPDIKTLEDVRTWVTPDDFEIVNYKHHEPLEYKLTV